MANGHRASTLHLSDGDAIEAVAESALGGKRGELLKLIAVIAFSALASYFATVQRIAVLETELRSLKEALTDFKTEVRSAVASRNP